MTETDATLIIEADEETVKELTREASRTSIESTIREIKGHAGDLGTWLAVLKASTPLIAAFIPYLIEKAKAKGPGFIKLTYKNWTVEGTFTAKEAEHLQKLMAHDKRR
jgi:hypothetical protein